MIKELTHLKNVIRAFDKWSRFVDESRNIIDSTEIFWHVFYYDDPPLEDLERLNNTLEDRRITMFFLREDYFMYKDRLAAYDRLKELGKL